MDQSVFESTPISQEAAEMILLERGVLNVKEWAKQRPKPKVEGAMSQVTAAVRANLNLIEKYNPTNHSILDILD